MAIDDVLHPTGRCTCAGEGTCEWCLAMEQRFIDAAENLVQGFERLAGAWRNALGVPDIDDVKREALGKVVRNVWISWARMQPNPKPSWLVPWEELSEPDKEVDRCIGERLYTIGYTDAKRGRA